MIRSCIVKIIAPEQRKRMPFSRSLERAAGARSPAAVAWVGELAVVSVTAGWSRRNCAADRLQAPAAPAGGRRPTDRGAGKGPRPAGGAAHRPLTARAPGRA